jgi:hypothetical protein
MPRARTHTHTHIHTSICEKKNKSSRLPERNPPADRKSAEAGDRLASRTRTGGSDRRTATNLIDFVAFAYVCLRISRDIAYAHIRMSPYYRRSRHLYNINSGAPLENCPLEARPIGWKIDFPPPVSFPLRCAYTLFRTPY